MFFLLFAFKEPKALFKIKDFPGVLSEVEPPFPIPNKEVKRLSAYDTEFYLGQWVNAGFFLWEKFLQSAIFALVFSRFRNYLPLILIVAFGLLLRLVYLDRIPTAIGGDELNYLLTAKSIVEQGTDLFGTWNPLSILIFRYPFGETQAELPYLFYTPAVFLFDLSLFSARITNVIFSTLLIVVVFLLGRRLFNEKVGLIASFLMAINPWFIYIGRTSYEATISVFFYLLSLYIILFFKGKSIYFALPTLLLAFYSYIATKVILVPFVLVAALFAYFVLKNKKYKREYLVLVLFSVILSAVFFLLVSIDPTRSRVGDIMTPWSKDIIEEVNDVRKHTVGSPAMSVLENKYTIFARSVVIKTIKSLSFEYHFVYGDNFFSLWRHGFFYFIDLIFLLAGSLLLFKKNSKVFLFLGSLLLIGVIPQVMHKTLEENFSIHITMLFPFVILLVSYGIYALIDQFKIQKVLFAGVFVLYLIFTLNFLHIYFLQHPLSGYFDFPVRVLSAYAQKADGPIDVYTPRSFDLYKKYLFYANKIEKENIDEIKKAYESDDARIGNIRFRGCNPDIDFSKEKNTILYDSECASPLKDTNHISIARLDDGGKVYKIYNDKVCRGVGLSSYPTGLSLSKFNIEGLSKQDLCATYITSN